VKVLSLCDLTGAMVAPWVAAGHDAWIVDTQHASGFTTEPFASGGTLTRVGCNVLDLVSKSGHGMCGWHTWDMVFSFPPCTSLSVSGARWFKSKGIGALIEALEVVEACRLICEESGSPWMLENPVSTISTYWREPDHKFNPWEYNEYRMSDTYWKKTCLWVGGGFQMPSVRPDRRTVEAMRQAAEKYPHIKNRGKLIAAVRADFDIDSDWFPDDRIHKAGPSAERANFRSATPAGFARAVWEDAMI